LTKYQQKKKRAHRHASAFGSCQYLNINVNKKSCAAEQHFLTSSFFEEKKARRAKHNP